MKLICRIYVVKCHTEVDVCNDAVVVKDRNIIEEECYIDTEDYLDLAEMIYVKLRRELTIKKLHDVRKALEQDEVYWLDGDCTKDLYSLTKVDYERQDGTKIEGVTQKIYLEKEWTIEK